MSDAAKPTRASSARKSPDLAICPHCGRMFVVTPGGVVCPHCGFPLVTTLERTPTAARVMEQMRGEGETEIGKLGVRFPWAKTILRESIPRSAILEVAAEIGAEMGTNGRTGLAHVFFGGVAEYVVRHSRVPVLTVRQHGE